MAWDVTRWAYDTVTGLCMSKTYADGADNGTATNEAWAVGGESATLVRELDEQGRLVALTGRDGAPSPSATSAQRYTYDTDGRLAAVSNAEAVAAYAYAPDGRDAGYTLTLANGMTFTRTVVRDPFRRDLVARIENLVNGTPVENLAYAYDALARPVSRNGDAFGYNARGEVAFSRGDAESAEEAYAYDHIGNAVLAASGGVTNAYAANALNQYTQVGRAAPCPPTTDGGLGQTALPITPAYDADGNLTGCGPWAFSYDAANRLVTVSSNGVLLVTNFYDAQSRRVRKATPEATTTYIYDGWNLVGERIVRVNGLTSAIRYYWGKDISGTPQGAGGVGGLLYLTVDGALYVPLCDNNGNVTHYCNANGAVVASYAYDAFGKTVAPSGPLADLFRHRFSTKYLDAETGLYYYGYRFYVLSLMRWLNRDPIEESGGLNLYGFCRNNAICAIDPLGQNRYMTTFSADPRKDQWHVGVAVDTWKCSNGQWVKTGVATFDFGIDDSSFWNRLGTYFVTVGAISEREGNALTEPFTLFSTPKQDVEMLKRIRSEVGNPPLYSFFFNNCIHWANKAIGYGMDR